MLVQAMPYPAGLAEPILQAPMADDGPNLAWSGAATYPNAFHDSTNNATWVAREAWKGQGRSVAIVVYDHTTETWGEEVLVSHDTLTNDTHGVPAIMMDADGYVHAFYGAHVGEIRHSCTLNPRDPSTWVQLANVGTGATYPNPIMVGSQVYLFTRENSLQTMRRRKATGTGKAMTWGSAQDVVTFSGGRHYLGVIEALGTDIHMIATYATSSDTARDDIYHYVYDTTNDALKNATGSVVTAVGSQPISRTTADANYRIFEQTTTQTSMGALAITPDGKVHAAFTDGAGVPYDIRHMVLESGTWSSSTVVATTTGGNDPGGGGANSGVIALIPNADNTVELWYSNDDDGVYTVGGNMYRRIRSTGGVWGSAAMIGEADAEGLERPSPVRGAHPDLKVLFCEGDGNTSDSSAGGLLSFAYGDGGYIARGSSLPSPMTPVSVGSDPHYHFTALNATFGGANGSTSFSDDSWHGHTITAGGSAQIQNNKLELNGSDAYAYLPPHILWAPGSKMSVEGFEWEFDDAVSTQTLISNYRGTTGQGGWNFNYENGCLYLFGSNRDATTARLLATAQFLPATDGTKYHIGWFWNGRTVCIVVDGVIRSRCSMERGFVFPDTRGLAIGCNFDSSNVARTFFNGRVAAVRVTVGQDRSGQQDFAPHALPLPSTGPALVDSLFHSVAYLVAYDKDADVQLIRDYGPYDIPARARGGIYGNPSGSLNGSPSTCVMDGSGDYIDLLDCPQTRCVEGEDVTFDGIVKLSNVSHNSTLSAKDGSSTSRDMRFFARAGTGAISFQGYNSSNSSRFDATGTTTIVAGTTYHMEGTVTGTAVKAYLNGAVEATAIKSATIGNTSDPRRLGRDQANTTRDFEGEWAWNRLTKASRHNAAFTPPNGTIPAG